MLPPERHLHVPARARARVEGGVVYEGLQRRHGAHERRHRPPVPRRLVAAAAEPVHQVVQQHGLEDARRRLREKKAEARECVHARVHMVGYVSAGHLASDCMCARVIALARKRTIRLGSSASGLAIAGGRR
jgi:hypothetical protein